MVKKMSKNTKTIIQKQVDPLDLQFVSTQDILGDSSFGANGVLNINKIFN